MIHMLKEEELLECLRGWTMDGTVDNWRKEDEQAYQQIKEDIRNARAIRRFIKFCFEHGDGCCKLWWDKPGKRENNRRLK